MAEDRMLSDEILLGLINKNSGGGGGTTNYNDLSNQPQIGGVTLIGNMSASDLGLATETALADKADKSAVKNEFLGTLEEWNALTVEQRKAYDTYQIKGDYTEGSGGLPDYSTTEQKTGQKWIDGKDIYFKVIVFDTAVKILNNNWFNSGIDASDVTNIINATAQTADGASCSLVGALDNGKFIFLSCRVDSAFIAKTIILFYTKTT